MYHEAKETLDSKGYHLGKAAVYRMGIFHAFSYVVDVSYNPNNYRGQILSKVLGRI